MFFPFDMYQILYRELKSSKILLKKVPMMMRCKRTKKRYHHNASFSADSFLTSEDDDIY